MRLERGGDHIELTGIILKGRYCIMERIGRGGEGDLYLARDLELGIYRAVKELPAEKKREAGLFRLLEHPSLPKMIDYTEQNGHCYLVMEYIRGKSLRQYLNEGRIFSGEEILSIAGTVLQILKYLHSRKPAVYYGDLKPDNLMLTESGRLYLVDFGSAVLGYERQSFYCLGTEGYAAPEQYQGRIVPASDFYALGKTVDELCQKRRLQYFFQFPGLGFFIRKCCFSQPEKRWRSAEEAENALQKIKPLSWKVWKGAAVGLCCFLCTAVIMGALTTETMQRLEMPELETAISPVTAWYYSMDFRSGGKAIRKVITGQIEKSGQRFLRIYDALEQQKQVLTLLARNSELEGNMAKAEGYYRQMLREKAGSKEYSLYGLFLIRQGRKTESVELYKLMKNRKDLKSDSDYAKDIDHWKEYLKQLSVLKGEETKYDLK